MRSRAAGASAASVREGRPRRRGAALVMGAAPARDGSDGRCQVEAGEGERLGEVGLTLDAGHRTAGVDLDDDMAVESGEREPFEHLGAGLRAAARDQVLVLVGAVAVGEVDMAEPVAHDADHLHGVAAGRRGVAEVDREVPVVLFRDVPVGGVREHLAVAVAPGVHVFDAEPDVRLVRHAPDAGDEVTRVLALPAEGGWTTTVDAPSFSAAAWARLSLVQGSVDQTRWVMRRQGAWIARMGIWW